MPFMNSISKIAKSVGDQATIASKKANDALEIAKINSSIKTEENKIEKLKTEIGNKIFRKFQNGELVDNEALEGCNAIIEIINAVDGLQNKIILIKNVKVCSNCNAEITLNAPFCPKCGANQEAIPSQGAEVMEEKLKCSKCGAELTEGTAFCSFCGNKI